MEQVQATNYDFSRIDFSSEKAYAYLMIENEIEKTKRHNALKAEATKRGQLDLFNSMVRAVKAEIKKKGSKQPSQELLEYERNDKGTVLRIWENLKRLYDARNIDLRFNELKKSIECNAEWYIYEDFLTEINSECRRTGLVLSKDDLWGFTSYIANKNAYNPVKQYLEFAHEKYKANKLTTQESEIGKLLKTITYSDACSQEDIKFNEKCLIMWLLTGAKIGMNNGEHNAEFTVTFKGKQGIGKTRWFRSLIPKEHLGNFFKDGLQLDLTNKDIIIQATSYWLCELGEVGGAMRKSDRDHLKAFITSPYDEFRTPYSRKSEKYPRRTFFACTVNDDEFLRDETGNRRFVVLDVKALDYMHTLDVDLIWGEVMELLIRGERTYLTQEEIEYNNHRNKQYTVKSDEQMVLEEYLPLDQPKDQWGYITCATLCDYVQESHGKTIKPRAVGKALKAMGIEKEDTSIKGKKGKYYKLPFLKGYSMPF